MCLFYFIFWVEKNFSKKLIFSSLRWKLVKVLLCYLYPLINIRFGKPIFIMLTGLIYVLLAINLDLTSDACTGTSELKTPQKLSDKIKCVECGGCGDVPG